MYVCNACRIQCICDYVEAYTAYVYVYINRIYIHNLHYLTHTMLFILVIWHILLYSLYPIHQDLRVISAKAAPERTIALPTSRAVFAIGDCAGDYKKPLPALAQVRFVPAICTVYIQCICIMSIITLPNPVLPSTYPCTPKHHFTRTLTSRTLYILLIYVHTGGLSASYISSQSPKRRVHRKGVD